MGCFGGLVRAVVILVTLACAVAVGVARLDPRPARFRLWQAPRHAAINGAFLSLTGTGATVFSTETGRTVPLRLPEGDVLDWVTFSDWISDDGESEIVGRWAARTGTGGKQVIDGVGLGRFAFPSGRPLDRVHLNHPPAGPPCWYPGNASRVLYAAADGNLHQYMFPKRDGAGDDGAPVDDQARVVDWRCVPAGVRGVFVADPIWPRDPRLGGRLLAAVSLKVAGRPVRRWGRSRIWWLALDKRGTTVVGASPVMDESGGPDHEGDERFPRVAAAPDGKLLLAYQVHCAGPVGTELYVAPLEFDPETQAPRIRGAKARRLHSGGLAAPPAFTPHADGLFTLMGTQNGRPRIERVGLGDLVSRGAPRSLTQGRPADERPVHPG